MEVTTEAKTEFLSTVTKARAGDVTAFSKSDRAAFFITAILTMCAFSAATAFGANNIITQVKVMVGRYYLQIAGIATLLAAACFLIAVLWTMLSPNSHNSQVPIAWIKKIIICYIAVLSIGGIIAIADEVTDGLGFTPG